MSSNYENQAPEVIAKEILVALIEKGSIDIKPDKLRADVVSEMYDKILSSVRKSIG